MKKYLASLALLIISNNLTGTALAATLEACLPPEPNLLISQFSFNSEEDFVTLTVNNDGNNGNGSSLNGWKLGTIDSTLKTFTNFPIRTGENYTFKDIPGLTGTTEQIVLINDKGDIKDAVCWTNESPTTQESADFLKLGDHWMPHISSCIPSSNLEKETIFTRNLGQDTNSMNDWQKITSALPKEISEPSEETPMTPDPLLQPTTEPVAINEVIINEFLPDPDGSDDTTEWIELKNISDHAVRLQGWSLDDAEGGSKPYIFKQEVIGAESFLLMPITTTHLTLNNTSDAVRLMNPSGKVVSSYAYSKTETGKSWARMKKGNWEITSEATPGEENEQERTEVPDKEPEEEMDAPESNTPSETSVSISEVFANPEGTDKGKEWIEIHNMTDLSIDLSGWSIQNEAGKTFTLPGGTSLDGEGYLILTDNITKIGLKNNGDQIQLLDADGALKDHIEFEKAPENVSFAKIATIGMDEEEATSRIMSWLIPAARAATKESVWEWTEMITKGKPNPTYYRIHGVVSEELNKEGAFKIERNGKGYIVQIDEKKIHHDLAKAVLKKGINIEITATDKEGTFILESYKIINATSAPNSTSIFITTFLGIGVVLAVSGVYAFLKSQKGLVINENRTPSTESTTHDDLDSLEPADTHSHKSQIKQLPS